ncbi:hypothetical protein EVAR_88858_1 [Eumeta japonica]|uniref:Uncharacterized protein n=1 Tax=Eumeta variegata TaxID=151549 RepID=A0A4C1Y5R3_EUMVA|nr:hypothetical protein EVAR_88858_1 [Eumeta japonica]
MRCDPSGRAGRGCFLFNHDHGGGRAGAGRRAGGAAAEGDGANRGGGRAAPERRPFVSLIIHLTHLPGYLRGPVAFVAVHSRPPLRVSYGPRAAERYELRRSALSNVYASLPTPPPARAERYGPPFW